MYVWQIGAVLESMQVHFPLFCIFVHIDMAGVDLDVLVHIFRCFGMLFIIENGEIELEICVFKVKFLIQVLKSHELIIFTDGWIAEVDHLVNSHAHNKEHERLNEDGGEPTARCSIV